MCGKTTKVCEEGLCKSCEDSLETNFEEMWGLKDYTKSEKV
jgi:hypothetical protein